MRYYLEYTYNLCDTFVSIQGEGLRAGTPAFFIRLSGCNLKCSFCDEPLHSQKKLAYKKPCSFLIEQVEKSGVKQVVITGGEPSMQRCSFLILELKEKGFFVSCETNGYCLANLAESDLITWSPKTLNFSSFNESLRGLFDKRAFSGQFEIKIPFCHAEKDIVAFESKARALLGDYLAASYVTAINDTKSLNAENNAKAVDFCLKNPQFRVNVQTHKILGVE